MSRLKITLLRGMVGCTDDQRATVRSLGLRKIRHSVERDDTPEVRGMVNKVSYLLSVEETSEEFKPFGRRSLAKQQREASKGAAKPG